MRERLQGAGWLPPLVLVLLLAGATLAPVGGALRLESGDEAMAERWSARLDALPDEPTVLVGFDPDLGTYAEIRPTVRVLVADLLNRGARLAFVSLTPEGRALALAEQDRLRRDGTNPARLADLGFVPGAEAGLVSLTRDLPAPGDLNAFGRGLVEAGMSDVDLALVVGGNDLGPRSWVEQVAPRVPDLSLAAVAPVVLLPELQPYLASGQLDALAATARDGALVRATSEPGTFELLVGVEPSEAAVLAGLLAAFLALGAGLVARLGRTGPGPEAR